MWTSVVAVFRLRISFSSSVTPDAEGFSNQWINFSDSLKAKASYKSEIFFLLLFSYMWNIKLRSVSKKTKTKVKSSARKKACSQRSLKASTKPWGISLSFGVYLTYAARKKKKKKEKEMPKMIFIKIWNLNATLSPRCLKIIAGRVTSIKQNRIQLFIFSKVFENPAHARTKWLVFASNHSSHAIFEDHSDKQFPEVYCNSAALMSPITIPVLRASSKTI